MLNRFLRIVIPRFHEGDLLVLVVCLFSVALLNAHVLMGSMPPVLITTVLTVVLLLAGFAIGLVGNRRHPDADTRVVAAWTYYLFLIALATIALICVRWEAYSMLDALNNFLFAMLIFRATVTLWVLLRFYVHLGNKQKQAWERSLLAGQMLPYQVSVGVVLLILVSAVAMSLLVYSFDIEVTLQYPLAVLYAYLMIRILFTAEKIMRAVTTKGRGR